MKIKDEYQKEFDIPEKIGLNIYKEEFKNLKLPFCIGEYPSQIEIKFNKKKKEEISEEEYRKEIKKEVNRIYKCLMKCTFRNKCLLISLLDGLRNYSDNNKVSESAQENKE